MNGLRRVGAAVWRRTARLVPGARRDWVEAVWAEVPETPPGLRRLAWRAGGVRLIVREALMRRRIGNVMLFAVVAAAAAWAAWPGSPGSAGSPGSPGSPGSRGNLATPVDRVDVIAVVLLLAGLPLLARSFLGPADGSRAARYLRVGTCAAFLALMPARVAVEQFLDAPPRGGVDLRLYLLINGSVSSGHAWGNEIGFLVVMALYVAAIVWVTSRRSRVAPATLAVGTGAGIALGLVMYAVAPLGLSKMATNPWLPGSDIDPLVVLAWLLLLCGPAAAAIAAGRRYAASSNSPPSAGARVRQGVAAGLVTSLVGALFVTVLNTGTTAAMLKAAWLRNWLYHGPHLLYGVQNLTSDLRTLPAIAYSHEVTASVDVHGFLIICVPFTVIALIPLGFGALILWGDAATGRGGPRRGGGGRPGPGPAPDPAGGGHLSDDAFGLTAGLSGLSGLPGLPGLHEPGPGLEQDRLTAALADAAV